MSVMSPRVVLGAVTNGEPQLPQSLGAFAVWSRRDVADVGGSPSFEYRHPTGRLVVVQRVALCALPDGRDGALYVAWVPSTSRTGHNAVFSTLATALVSRGLMVAWWSCDETPEGALVCSALDTDATPAGTTARAAWPADWRVRLPTDDNGDPFGSPPVAPAPPTGQRCLGVVIA